MSEKEAYYDAEIAPALLDLAKKCQAKGITLLAFAEWDMGMRAAPEGGAGSTHAIANPLSAHARQVWAAMQSNGNIDLFIMWVLRDAKEHGHSSAYITILENKYDR